MTRHLITIIFLALGTSAFAQFGLRAGISSYKISSQDVSLTEMGGEVAGHYWFRLKNLRIEFYPEISYSSYNHNEFAYTRDITYDWTQWGVGVPIRIYPLDLKSDCDCPTFSKQNDLIKKGLFLLVSPGYYLSTRMNFEVNESDWSTPPDVVSTWESNFGLAFGVGLDIGLSDLVTLSPAVQYSPFLGKKEGLTEWIDYEINFGITATFRPDY